MDDNDVRLARLRSVLETATAIIECIYEGDPLPEEDRALVCASVDLIRTYQPRSKADALRWVQAYQNGDEAWLIVRCRPSGVDATYFPTLPAEVARFFR